MKIHSSIFFLIKFFIIQLIINLVFAEDCLREKPLLKEDSCEYYCEKEEFNDNICTINNTLAKIQWLNNIIFLGEENFTYFNFANYSNEDIIIEITSSTRKNEIVLYGLNNEGGPLFRDNYFSSIEINEQVNNIGRLIVDNFIVTINNEKYLVNIEEGDYYTRIYDLKNLRELSKKTNYRSV